MQAAFELGRLHHAFSRGERERIVPANPTLTILALAHRLAQQLLSQSELRE